jgi:plasmid maintenance system antidote protein VapI
MMSTQDFEPDWASPPGETITAILKERSLTAADLGNRIEQSRGDVEALLEGRSTITLALARRLSGVLGASVEFWMARDYTYRETISKLQASQKSWLSELPIADMVKFDWLNAAPSELVGACLRFFGVPSVSAWRASYGSLLNATAFRASQSFKSQPGAVAAWLRAGELEAAAISCGTWNPDGFQQTLSKARGLTRQKDPNRFIPRLRELCAESGVAVAIVRAPNGCRASGATRFITPEKAVLQLSFRFLTDDQFWFTFFHEAGHLLLHGRGRLFLEEGDVPATAQENEANDFAVRTLIPAEEEAAMIRLPGSSEAVIRFATRIGVAPGIVVGQLQHRGRLRPNYLNGLKRRFTWNAQAITRGTT